MAVYLTVEIFDKVVVYYCFINKPCGLDKYFSDSLYIIVVLIDTSILERYLLRMVLRSKS